MPVTTAGGEDRPLTTLAPDSYGVPSGAAKAATVTEPQ